MNFDVMIVKMNSRNLSLDMTLRLYVRNVAAQKLKSLCLRSVLKAVVVLLLHQAPPVVQAVPERVAAHANNCPCEF
jgi:hypothetical protein